MKHLGDVVGCFLCIAVGIISGLASIRYTMSDRADLSVLCIAVAIGCVLIAFTFHDRAWPDEERPADTLRRLFSGRR